MSALFLKLGNHSEVKLKPPYTRLYIKDFAFDVQEMTDEQLGKYMRSFMIAYKSEKIPKEKENETLFKELKKSFSQYSAVCERNRKNRLKTNTYKNESSTTGQGLGDHSLTTNQNHKPITKRPNKIVNIHTSKPVDNVDNSKGSLKKIDSGLIGRSFDIRNHLKDDDYIDICGKINKNWDRNKIFEKYNAWIDERGEPKSPRKAFLGWLDKNSDWLKQNP